MVALLYLEGLAFAAAYYCSSSSWCFLIYSIRCL